MNIQTMIHISEVTLMVLAVLGVMYTLQNQSKLSLASVSWNR